MREPTFKRAVCPFDKKGNPTPGTMELTIDVQRLSDMLARKAVKNKSGLTKLAAGYIVAKFTAS